MDIPEVFCAPFHESSNRSHLTSGCETKALAMAFVSCVLIAYGLLTWWGIGGAVLLFLFLRHGLRILAKEDPNMLNVYSESQRYNRGFWTAKPVRAPHWSTK